MSNYYKSVITQKFRLHSLALVTITFLSIYFEENIISFLNAHRNKPVIGPVFGVQEYSGKCPLDHIPAVQYSWLQD